MALLAQLQSSWQAGRMVRSLLFAGAALSILGAGMGYAALTAYRQRGPLEHATSVVVPRGPFAGVAAALRTAGVVDLAWELRGFEAATYWQGPARAAEFSFPAGVSIERVLLILRHGRPVEHLVTVPEGVTSARVAQIFSEAGGLSGQIAVPVEGDFLPQSYAYELGDETGAVLRRGRAAMAGLVQLAWRTRAAWLPLRSARELVILASLVERETHLPGERARVAAVFVNRLRLGMRLQADSSTEYGASGGAEALGHGLRHDELVWATPYNTYVNGGLPEGAICNPGEASILASANPAASDALYFVADGLGGHVFARSLDEHLRNVARYRALGR